VFPDNEGCEIKKSSPAGGGGIFLFRYSSPPPAGKPDLT
jgi:hypothetical protein